MTDSTPEPSTIQIPLPRGYVTIIDEVDADLIHLNWRVQLRHNNATGTPYAVRKSKGGMLERIHRIILSRILGRDLLGGELCDHKDGNGLNNCRSNLRLATHAQNMRNSQIRRNNTSGYKGVMWYAKTKKWRARIRFNNQGMDLGDYKDIKDAARAYNEAALKYHGEFACLNVIED